MSVRLRISLITGLLLLCVLVLVSIFTLRAQRAQLHQESVKRIELALSMLSEMAGPPLGQGDILALADVAERAARGQPDRVCVADMHGIVLVDSKHELYTRTTPILQTVIKTGKRYVARTGDLWQGAAPVRDYRGHLSGVVYVSFSARPMDLANAQVTRGVVIFALCLMGLGALVAYAMGFYFSAALTPLLAAIRKTADGDYGGTIRRTGMFELDEIGQAFDKMTGLVGSEVHNLGTLNQLAANLTAAKTLEQFADILHTACRTLVDGCGSLLCGDPRMGIVELIGGESPKRRVTHESAVFLAVNERRPVSIGQDSELPPDSPVAEGMTFGSGIVAPLITPDHAAVGSLAVEIDAVNRPSPNRQDEATIMAVANLAAPILATLVRASTQDKAMAALAEILQPEEIPQPAGLEIHAGFEPAEVSSGLGGDYYDVLPLGGDMWGIAIGDVSGKGLDAARYTAMTKYVVRSFALEHTSPAEIMSHTDEALSAQMGETRFVTLFYCIIDPKHKTITYCCAGHLPGLLYRAESDDFVELSVGGGVVGMGWGATSAYEQDTVQLKQGDTLLLYTDGLSEAAQRGHEEYGLERLKAVVSANTRRSLKNVGKAVMDDVRTFALNVARDDMTLVLLRLSEEGAEGTG
jgi:serine phosphatase RsbU (regulator of sigma subunit)